jgi:hypothetical protein
MTEEEAKTKWGISIYDGYVEYRYTPRISDRESIDSVKTIIGKALGVRMGKGKIINSAGLTRP